MEWTAEHITTALNALRSHGGDSPYLELKKASGGMPQNLGPTLCAFANMPDGGTLILGVDEKDNFAITEIEKPAQLQASIVSLARNNISPSPYIEFSTPVLNGKTVLVAEVQGLPIGDKPARYKGKAYLRQADGDYPMNDAELRMLEVAKFHADEQVSYDEAPVPGTSAQNLDQSLTQEYVGAIRQTSRRLREKSDTDILRQTSVTTASGELTLAGLYALASYPQGPRPALEATAAVILPADAPGRHQNLQTFYGPLPEMLSDMLRWTEGNLPTTAYYGDDGNLRNVPIIPLAIAREIIANALVHRNLGPYTLGLGKSVHVRILPDRLVVESPGGVIGLSVRQLESSEHAQVAVNQRLYNIVRHLRTPDGAQVIEGEGGGIREVLELAHTYQLPKPQFINTGVKFKVIIFFPKTSVSHVIPEVSRRSYSAPQTVTDLPRPHEPEPSAVYPTLKSLKNAQVVMDAFEGQDRSVTEISRFTGLTARQVRYVLHALMREGYVEMDASAGPRNTVYRLITP